MMPLVNILTLLLLLQTRYVRIAIRVQAQVALPKCTDPAYSWMNNHEGQDPCAVGGNLLRACDGAAHPTGCSCNTVFYSLFYACGMCADDQALEMTWTTFSEQTEKCGSTQSQTYPMQIPPDTGIPAWAFLPLEKDVFDAEQAQNVASSKLPDATTPGSYPFPTPSTSDAPGSVPPAGTSGTPAAASRTGLAPVSSTNPAAPSETSSPTLLTGHTTPTVPVITSDLSTPSTPTGTLPPSIPPNVSIPLTLAGGSTTSSPGTDSSAGSEGTSVTASPPAPPDMPSPTHAESQRKTDRRAAIIGGAVGGGVSALLAAGAGWLSYRRRRQRRVEQIFGRAQRIEKGRPSVARLWKARLQEGSASTASFGMGRYDPDGLVPYPPTMLEVEGTRKVAVPYPHYPPEVY